MAIGTKLCALFLLACFAQRSLAAADMSEGLPYFPAAQTWAMANLSESGWDQTRLAAVMAYARDQRSSGLMILHDGLIVAEQYWPVSGGPAYRQLMGSELPDGRRREDVASLQKSIVAVLVMKARAQGKLDLDNTITRYLNPGWSRASPEQEAAITIRHVMSMTSGLDSELNFKTPPGSAWVYNTAVYSRLIPVLEAAAGEGIEALSRRWLTLPLGMTESGWESRNWVTAGADANSLGFIASARDIARFGIMLLAHGRWHDQSILSRADVAKLVEPSQTMNPAYGLLWWVNRETGLTAAGPKQRGPLFLNAPERAWFALGALQRVLCIVPDQNLIIVRLGAEPEPRFVDTLWGLLKPALPPARSLRP